MRYIIPTGQQLGWLDAREAVKDKGGLPSNVLLDDLMLKTVFWKLFRVSALWVKEILVYPKHFTTFEKGKDVVDPYTDDHGRKWVFPASHIPKEALKVKNVGLFIDNPKVEISNKRVVISAAEKDITILRPLIQLSGKEGIVDKKTRVPLDVPSQKFIKKLNDGDKRRFLRNTGPGVRPLVRFVVNYYYAKDVAVNYRHDWNFGAAYVVNE